MSDSSTDGWVKASASIAAGACVELASSGGVILVRDSKDPSIHLPFSRDAISDFLSGIKDGEFDYLTNGLRVDT